MHIPLSLNLFCNCIVSDKVT